MPSIKSFVDLVREKRHSGMTVVEVGVWQGETALAWLPIVREEGGKGILIDHFKGNLTAPSEPAFWDPAGAEVRCNLLAQRLYVAGYEGVAEIWQMNSRQGALELADGSCDIIFIDADHRYSQVKADLASYLPKVRPGGILCGHDAHDPSSADLLPPESLEVDYWHGRHCGVDRALWETFGTDGVELLGENVWARRIY